MSYFRINMLNVFIAFLLFCTANCKKEDFSNLSDLFDNPNLLNEIEKRLGILDEDRPAPPKVGCYALSGTFESGCRYKSNSSKIIKTTESLSRGAKYLEEYTNVSCPQECSARCCDHPNCDTAVFRNKSDHNCYLFQCGEPSMCVFVHHDDYWMTSVSIDDHNSHSFSPGGGTVSHENELENLGAGAGPGAGSGEQSQATSEPARPTTTTSEPATTHIPRLGESCPSYETQCDDPHAECLLKQCQCRGGYHPLNGICRKRCQMDEFQCELIVHGPMMRDCIPAVYTCDGIKQCINGSDEKDCPSPQQSPAYEEEDLSGNTIYRSPSLNAQYANVKDNTLPYGFPLQGLTKNQGQGAVLPPANQLYPGQIPTNQNIGGQYYVPGLTNQNVGIGLPQTGGQISNQWPFLDKTAGLGAPIYPAQVQYPAQQNYIPGQNGFVPFLQNPLVPVQPVNQNRPVSSVNAGGASNIQPVQQNQPIQQAVSPVGQSTSVDKLPSPVQLVVPASLQTVSSEAGHQTVSSEAGHQQYQPPRKPVSDGRDDTDDDYRFPTFPDTFDDSSRNSVNNAQDSFADVSQPEPQQDTGVPQSAAVDKGPLLSEQEADHGRNSAELDENIRSKQRTYPPSTKSKLQIGSPTQSTVPGQKTGQSPGKLSESLLDYPWMGLSYDSDSPRISGKKGRPSMSGQDGSSNRQLTQQSDGVDQKSAESKFDKDKDALDDVGNKYGTMDTEYDESNSRYPDRVNPSNRYDSYRRPSKNRRPSYNRYNDRYPDSRGRPSHGSRYPAYYDQGYQPARGRHNFPVWDQLKDEYYYPDDFENRRLGPSNDVEYKEYRPEDSVNSDKRPFLDNPSKQDPGSDRHPSVGTGSSPDGTQSSDRNTGIHRKPAKEDPESKQEPAQPDVIPPVRKTTVAPVKVSTTTKVEEPKKPTEKPKEIAEIPDTAPDMADQASVDSDSSSSESEETQSNPDKTDDQFTESKNRSKSDSIEVMFLDKNTVVESYSDNNQGPIVALALGLGITLVMLIFVGCRLRNVKRRLRKGRALHSNEADYLINGMYL